jgi:NDP-sugar pyrophosphorylase family protein
LQKRKADGKRQTHAFSLWKMRLIGQFGKETLQTKKEMNSPTDNIYVMVLAAGLGTRLGELTQKQPKALATAVGKTLLEITLNKLKNDGFKHFIINIHHFGEQILSYLQQHKNFGLDIQISDERGQLMDTGGALLHAKPLVPKGKLLLVHNVDIISSTNLNELIAYHIQNNAAATLVVKERDSSRKLLFDQEMHLCGWKNKQTNQTKQLSNKPFDVAKAFSFSGIYIIKPEVLDTFAVEPCSVIDLFLSLAENHKILGYNDPSDLWLDVGKPEQLKQLELLINTQ